MADHLLNQIGEHVYWLTPDSRTDRPVLGVITGTRGTLVVDAGNSPAHARVLLEAVEAAGLPSPTFAALTHWHWDHVFGSAALALPTIAHRETARIVSEMAALDWSDRALDQRVAAGTEIAFCRDMIKAELPDRHDLVIRPPDITFGDSIELDLGGVTCEIVHVGGDHAADSSVIYVPGDNVLFLGDCIYPDIYHTVRRYTTAKLFPLLDRLLGFDAECYLPGHHPEPMGRAEMIEERVLLQAIGDIVNRGGRDRAAILAQLKRAIDGPITEDHLELVEEFIGGLPEAADNPLGEPTSVH